MFRILCSSLATSVARQGNKSSVTKPEQATTRLTKKEWNLWLVRADDYIQDNEINLLSQTAQFQTVKQLFRTDFWTAIVARHERRRQKKFQPSTDVRYGFIIWGGEDGASS